MKKILIFLIACMFLTTMLPGIFGSQEANEHILKVRKFIENREIIPIYTEHGLEKVPAARGK